MLSTVTPNPVCPKEYIFYRKNIDYLNVLFFIQPKNQPQIQVAENKKNNKKKLACELEALGIAAAAARRFGQKYPASECERRFLSERKNCEAIL